MDSAFKEARAPSQDLHGRQCARLKAEIFIRRRHVLCDFAHQALKLRVRHASQHVYIAALAADSLRQ